MKEEQVIICNSQICNYLRICSANYIMLLLNPISGPDLEKQYSAEVIWEEDFSQHSGILWAETQGAVILSSVGKSDGASGDDDGR